MQQRRMERARPIWQMANHMPDRWPDLGVLLDWFLDRVALEYQEHTFVPIEPPRCVHCRRTPLQVYFDRPIVKEAE